MISCYNAARNDPFLEHHHPRYTELNKVPDGAIKQAGLRFGDASNEADFLTRATATAESPS